MFCVNKLEITYKEKLFEPVSFSINTGELIVLKGASGIGKSSVLNAIAGFVPFTGSVSFNNEQFTSNTINMMRNHIAFLPQNINFPYEKVNDYFSMLFSLKMNKAEAPSNSAINTMLEKLLLNSSILKKSIQEVSGGQLQRVALAACLLMNKKLLLLDEPTTGLDADTVNGVIEVISDIPDTYSVCISHDEAVLQKANSIIELKKVKSNT